VSAERLSLGAAPGPDGAAAAERSRAREAFETIVGRMPEEQRIVFVLFEVEGMSGETIAAALDVPVGTVRSRLRLARAALDQAVARLQARDAGPRAAFRTREA
jgi:RNA polymerase sigma-70 factor (ECF subfamily)